MEFENTEIGNTTELELKIKLQKEFNTTLLMAYPLCILLSEEQYLPWYMEHFIQAFGMFWKDKTTDLFLSDSFVLGRGYTGGICREWLNLKPVGKDKLLVIDDIISYICTTIRNKEYLIIFLDEYYLKSLRSESCFHFIHELLVYGYDMKHNMVLCLGFDNRKEFTKLRIPEKEFVQAQKKALEQVDKTESRREGDGWIAEQLVVKVKIREDRDVTCYNRRKFFKELDQFIHAVEIPRVIEQIQGMDVDHVCFGLDTYDVLIQHLENIIHGIEVLDYRQIHLFFESKNAIYLRLKYAFDFDLTNGLNEKPQVICLEEYQDIVVQVNQIRIVLLKHSLKALNFTKLQNVVQTLQRLKQKEKSVLERCIR